MLDAAMVLVFFVSSGMAVFWFRRAVAAWRS